MHALPLLEQSMPLSDRYCCCVARSESSGRSLHILHIRMAFVIVIALATGLATMVFAAPLPQRAAPAAQPSVKSSDEATAADPRGSTKAMETQRVDKGRRVAPLGEGEDAPWDRFIVDLPIEAATLLDPAARQGRVIIFLRSLESRATGDPADGPFFSDPEPVGSVEVAALAPGMSVEVGATGVWWPDSAGRLLDGEYLVQAVFASEINGPGHNSVGNILSKPITVEFHRGEVDEVTLSLSQRIAASPPSDERNITEVSFESALLSKASGKRVNHEASVVFPREYGNLNAKRRVWPTVYVVPAAGTRHSRAREIAGQLAEGALANVMSQAVYVILEDESQLGPHGFMDSAANGPRATALVSEFVPHLEERFRLVRDKSARVVQGHSSGGWAAIHLALEFPGVFSAAFASAPEPLDFASLSTANIYADENLFESAKGEVRPAYREILGPAHDLVPMLIWEEIGIDRAISPEGKSAGRWDAWAAMLSSIDPRTNDPRRLCDPVTGAIDPVTVEEWAKHDIARQALADPAGFGRRLATSVGILVGARDSFYVDRAALHLKDALDGCARSLASVGEAFPDGPGYIEVVPGATHDGILPLATLRFGRDIRNHFRAGKHHE